MNFTEFAKYYTTIKDKYPSMTKENFIPMKGLESIKTPEKKKENENLLTSPTIPLIDSEIIMDSVVANSPVHSKTPVHNEISREDAKADEDSTVSTPKPSVDSPRASSHKTEQAKRSTKKIKKEKKETNDYS